MFKKKINFQEGQIAYWQIGIDIEKVEIFKITSKGAIWIWRINREECFELRGDQSESLFHIYEEARDSVISMLQERINEDQEKIKELE